MIDNPRIEKVKLSGSDRSSAYFHDAMAQDNHIGHHRIIHDRMMA
jgi:hypothetical protein